MNNIADYIQALQNKHFHEQHALFQQAFKKYQKIIILGNGGSNAMASHLVQDYVKVYGKNARCFSDASMLTCFINDYGADHAYVKFLENFAEKDTLCILISSRGESHNIINCVKWCEEHPSPYAILTGFDSKNQTRKFALNPVFDLHVNSDNYGVVECVHQIFLHAETVQQTKGIVAGSFDVIHPGYIKMFQEAKLYCDHLTIALHADPSIERQQKLQPVQTVEERKTILKSIRYVDSVAVYQQEHEFLDMLKSGKYHIRFLGTDYKTRPYTGTDLPVQIVWLDRNHNYSSTLLKDKIYSSILNKKQNGEIYD